MKDLVEESIAVLNSNQDIKAFGELLMEAWDAKRSLSAAVSNQDVDNMHALAIEAGAIGGKITGAGGGGFLLLFVPPEKQEQVRAALHHFVYVPFKFDFSGSQIIYARQEQEFGSDEISKIVPKSKEFREL